MPMAARYGLSEAMASTTSAMVSILDSSRISSFVRPPFHVGVQKNGMKGLLVAKGLARQRQSLVASAAKGYGKIATIAKGLFRMPVAVTVQSLLVRTQDTSLAVYRKNPITFRYRPIHLSLQPIGTVVFPSSRTSEYFYLC